MSDEPIDLPPPARGLRGAREPTDAWEAVVLEELRRQRRRRAPRVSRPPATDRLAPPPPVTGGATGSRGMPRP